MRSIADAHSIEDFRRLAARRLPRMVFDFFDGGSGSESTLAGNRAALERLRLVGSAPVDVAGRSLATTLFGRPLEMPIIIGPTGLAGAGWPRADLALAAAAGRHGIPFVMSSAATATMEGVAGAGGGAKWFQLYLFRDRSVSERLMQRAARLGFEALEVTVDNAIPGRRLRDERNGFTLPLRWTPRKLANVALHPGWALQMARAGAPTLAVMAAELGLTRSATIAQLMQQQLDPSISWRDIRWVRDRWHGPLIVKGLLDPQQAGQACEIGVDAIVVSNHGGRQLDGSAATIEMLPEFVAEVRGRMPLLVDSGFRSGSDIAKALALGAAAVQLGRATLYAAAAGGQPGVERALELLRAELDVALCLLGARRVGELHAGMVRGSRTAAR